MDPQDKPQDTFDRLLGVMKSARNSGKQTQFAENFNAGVIRDIRQLSSAEGSISGFGELFSDSSFFRFAFGTFLMTLFVHGCYRLSAIEIEQQFVQNDIVGLDPFDLSGTLDE